MIDVVVTDYGSYPISQKAIDAYIGTHGKKRAGKLTKASRQRAYDALSRDVSAIVRFFWTKGVDVPRGIL